MKTSKRIFIVLVSICMFIGIFQPSLIALGVDKQTEIIKVKPQENQKITLSSKSYAEIVNANILPGEKGTLSFTLSIYNGDNKEINFINYWVKVKTKAGQSYPIKLVSSDTNKNSISPLTTQQFTFYTTVNNTTKIQDIVVELIEWDFNQVNLEKKLGVFSLVEKEASLGTTKLNVSGLNVVAKIEKSVINTGSEYLNAKVTFKLYNMGVESVIVPKFNYYIKTSSGILYTLTQGEDKEISIQPKDDFFLKLSGKIPISISNEGWQLIVAKVEETDKIKVNIPIATYQMVEGEETPISNNLLFSTEDGDYEAKIVSLQRLPYKDKDILSATIEFRNNGTETLPVPTLTGSFLLDSYKVESKAGTQLEQLNTLSRIAPNSKIEFVFLTEIPYTMEYTNLEIALQGKEEDAQIELGTISAKGIYATLPGVREGQTYNINDIGNKTELQVRSTKTYTSKNFNLVYVEMLVNNMEKRAKEILPLGGYFVTKDGAYYPATVTEIKDVMNPNSRALIAFWSKLPKGNTINDLQLMVGRSVKYGEATNLPIIEAVSFALPGEVAPGTAGTGIIEVFPYNFSIDRVVTSLVGSVVNQTASGLKIDISYRNFKELEEFERKFEGHELLVEFIDSYSGTVYTEKTDLTRISSENGVLTVTINTPDILSKMPVFGLHIINLYDQFEGGKKLISTAQGYVGVIN